MAQLVTPYRSRWGKTGYIEQVHGVCKLNKTLNFGGVRSWNCSLEQTNIHLENPWFPEDTNSRFFPISMSQHNHEKGFAHLQGSPLRNKFELNV